MNLIEFISFIAAMLLLMVSMRQKSKTSQQVDADQEEQVQKLREYLLAVNSAEQDAQEGYHPKKSQPAGQREHKVGAHKPKAAAGGMARGGPHAKELTSTQHPQQGSHGYATASKPAVAKPASHDAYAFKKPQNSRAHSLVQGLKSPKEMLLLHEIMAPPKALRGQGLYEKFPS
jgi:hypothetical protein